MEKHQTEFFRKEDGRKWLIEKLTEKEKVTIITQVQNKKTGKIEPKKTTIKKCFIENQFHEHHTRYELCEQMINIVKGDLETRDKKILVLYNLEFLEVLLNKFNVNKNNITLITDIPLKQKIGRTIYKIENIYIANNLKELEEIIKNMALHFDLCFSNPPYGDQQDPHRDVNILSAIIPICEELVLIHPSLWVLDIKSKEPTNPNQILRNHISNKIKSLEFRNAYHLFGIKLSLPCVITHVVPTPQNFIDVTYLNGYNQKVPTIDDITVFQDKWIPIVKPFKIKIENYIKHNMGNIGDYSIVPSQVKNKDNCCQIAENRGNLDFDKNDQSKLLKHDFYTFITLNPQKVKGLRKDSGKSLVFEFKTINERDNFIQYLMTDFARFCLALGKINRLIDKTTCSFVPWLDFKTPWDDLRLYHTFQIDPNTQNYIKEFLPDFHKIRK